jgi:hypothetical protein
MKHPKCAAHNCQNIFVKVTHWQKYCSPECKNREAQRRLRERAAKYLAERKAQ